MLTVLLLLALAALIVVILRQPDEFRVSRSITIGAPAEIIFNEVNDFHRWEAWSPWARLDPNATYIFDGPAAGEGAQFSWSGNNKVGAGKMTITQSQPNSLIRIRLEFVKPMPGVSTVEFLFHDHEGHTHVTWAMFGRNNFIAKAMSLVMNCDKMIGGYYEKGLAQLKEVAQAEAARG